jgi:HSP20 family protein
MADKQSTLTPARQESQAGRAPTTWHGGPSTVFQRFADEMDRMFEGFGVARPWRTSPLWRSGSAELWNPDIDVYEKDGQLMIKADLPGLRREDVSVDITEDDVTIQGERKTERQENREGVYRNERSYGTFCRVIPLPPGAMTDQAKATFHDGVLEIAMPAPPASTKGRRLEITEAKK